MILTCIGRVEKWLAARRTRAGLVGKSKRVQHADDHLSAFYTRQYNADGTLASIYLTSSGGENNEINSSYPVACNSCLGMNFNEAELIQYLSPVGAGPSLNK